MGLFTGILGIWIILGLVGAKFTYETSKKYWMRYFEERGYSLGDYRLEGIAIAALFLGPFGILATMVTFDYEDWSL